MEQVMGLVFIVVLAAGLVVLLERAQRRATESSPLPLGWTVSNDADLRRIRGELVYRAHEEAVDAPSPQAAPKARQLHDEVELAA